MTKTLLAKKVARCIVSIAIVLGCCHSATGQMRQLYVDNTAGNEIYKFSFYTPSEGFVAFRDWVGYTQDSGRTFTKRFITNSNVNFGSYSVNITFGFEISGVKAFDQNNIVVYGDYGFVPAILYSSNGGASYTLIFHNQFAFIPNSIVYDMVFPQNNTIGYAVDVDRILKTSDQGHSWSVIRTEASGNFSHLEAVDNSNVFAFSTTYGVSRLIKTSNAGSSWQNITIPAGGTIFYAHFISNNNGWLVMQDNTSTQNGKVYYTANGGTNWTQMNNTSGSPFLSNKIHFINDSTGFGLVGFDTYKTTDSGKVWEPLPRDNNYGYLGYGHNDLQFINNNQFWSGGGHGFLEINTNAGGATLPKALFAIDTSGVNVSSTVHLYNYSKPSYQYKWYVNNTLISTSYNCSYTHALASQEDSVKLIVIKGALSDTLVQYQYFVVPNLPVITSFSPTSGSTGTFVTINGTGLSLVSAVKFGGVPAASFTVVSDAKITAIVAGGATGAVSATDLHGTFSLPGFTYNAPYVTSPPVVTSFTPESGPVGTSVTITGNNFGTSPANNTVYFGAVKAVVTAASAIQLTCVVPIGATYKPISVLNRSDNQTGQSLKPFNVTFADSSNFTPHSFTNVYEFANPNNAGTKFVMGKDIDGDGVTDMVCTIEAYQDSVAIYRNTTTGGTLSFESRKDVAILPVWGTGMFDVADIDGDGKPDIASSSNNASGVSVVRNTSTPGNISFEPQVNIPGSTGSLDIKIADLDNDGKNDIAVAVFDISKVSVIRNTSVPGAFSFTQTINLASGANTEAIAVGDIDGDGKKDIVSLNYIYGPPTASNFSYIKNNSTPGNFVFAPKVDITVPGISSQIPMIELADYDNDNKLDVIIITDGFIIIYRNISTVGTIAFAPAVTLPVSGLAQGGHVANLSGDAKPDIVSGNWSISNLSLYRNLSAAGSISTDNSVNISARYPYYTNSADFDMDGKLDIITSSSNDKTMNIYKNTMGVAIPFSFCVNSTAVYNIYADISGSTYQWQQDDGSGSGFINLTNNANISGAQTANLGFTNISFSWNGYKYRCLVNGNYSSQYIMQLNGVLLPVVTISTPVTSNCYGTPVTFTATGVNGGTNPFYRWQVNGFTTGTNSPVFTTTFLNNNDKVRVILTSSDYCLNFPSDTSNEITMTVTGTTPTATITTPVTTICDGSSVSFTAAATGGTIVSYQWYVNGSKAGTNSAIFTTTGLTLPGQVRVLVTVTLPCGSTVIVSSNIITMTIIGLQQPYVNISTTTINVCTATPVTFTAVPQTGGSNPVYQWQVNGINTGTNSPTFITATLNNSDQVKVIMTSSATCLTQPTATSNILTMNVGSPVAASLAISTSSTTVCAGSNVTFTATPTNGGTSPVYQWKKNGVNVGNNSTTYSTNSLVNGDVITATLTSNGACVSPATVTSNALTISIASTPLPGIIISGNTRVTLGTATTILPVIINAGISPAFQWQDSTHSHGWLDIAAATAPIFNYTPLLSGDKLRCILTANTTCISGITVTSAALEFTVDPPVAGGKISFYPNPTGNTLTIDSLLLAIQWQTVSIFSMNGSANSMVQNIVGLTKVVINVSNLPAGVYIAILRNKDGETAYFKFVKL